MSLTWEESGDPVWGEAVASPLRLHHPYHAAASEATGRRVRHMALRDKGVLRGAAQIGIRRWPGWGDFGVLARGPIWADDLDRERRQRALQDLLGQVRANFRGVMAAPDLIAGQDPLDDGPWLTVVTPVGVAEVPLDAAPEVLRARQAPKWRNRVRRAEGRGITVSHAPWRADPDHWLLKAEAQQRRTRGYKGAEDAYTLAWAAIDHKRTTRLFTARINGKTVAAMLFLLHPPGASYHIGWTDETGRAAGAHPLLMWRAVLWLAAHGYRSLDLDVIDTVTAPGLARFKLGAGAEVVTTGATRLWAPGTALIRRLVPRTA
ncbi:MAG: GNAT family N-acetyltransferase [Pseudomonadota bacterium]